MLLDTAQPWIGVNFWSRGGGPRMWSRYEPATVRQELATMARHGCSVTRSFCYWPDFVPEPLQLSQDAVEHFADFLDAHLDLQMLTIPTFIVGHMSGENWDPAWRQGRDLYRDVWMVAQQAWLAEQLSRRFHRHPAVTGWLISNEMPLYGLYAPEPVITSWARLMVQAVRAGGATQPVSLGDGAWGIEQSGTDNGFSLRALAPIVDFLGPHVYPMSDDPVRQMLAAAFACALCGSFGRPVILEEFGVSSDFVSDEHAAAYYRQVLHSSLLAGARGWLAWNNCDYDNLAQEDPYRHHPFEMHFGLTDSGGRPKAQLAEMARFSRLVQRLSPGGWSTALPEVALVVPEHFERSLPFTTEEFRSDIRRCLFQAFIAARECDLSLSIVREVDGIAAGPGLYLLPCAKQITAPGMASLQERVRAGATLYASYFAGSTANQRGPWVPWLGETFGFAHDLYYGLADPIDGDELEIRFVRDFGGIAAGRRLRFRVGGNSSGRSRLPLKPTAAEVVAVDASGEPAILYGETGKGRTVFCTYPLEYMAASLPNVNPEPTADIYAALAQVSGIRPAASCDDRRVLVGRLQLSNDGGVARSGADRVVIAANCSGTRVDTSLQAQGALTAFDQRPGDGAVESVTLDPWQVEVLSLGE